MFSSSQKGKCSIYGGFFSITLNKLKSAVTSYSKCMDHVAQFQVMYSNCTKSVSVSNNYSKYMRFSYLLELYGLSACDLTMTAMEMRRFQTSHVRHLLSTMVDTPKWHE